MIKTASHPTGKVISFSEDDHKYIDNDGNEYCPCTDLIHEHFPKFDTEFIAARYAEKNNLDVNEVKKQWEDNKVEAAEFGSRIHEFAENLLLGKPLPHPKNQKEEQYFQAVMVFITDKLAKDYMLIDSEKIIFSPLYRIAGTVDLLMLEKESRKIAIMDWKTNKEIKYSNRFQRGFGQLIHLEDCNFNHYSLQLNLYRKLLVNEGYHKESEIGPMTLFHVTATGVVVIEVPVMTRETNFVFDTKLKTISQ